MEKNIDTFEKQVKKSKDKRFTFFNVVLIVAIFIGLFIYMIMVDGIHNILLVLQSVNYAWVVAGLVCMLLSWVSEAICLHIPIKKLYPTQTFWMSLRIMMDNCLIILLLFVLADSRCRLIICKKMVEE